MEFYTNLATRLLKSQGYSYDAGSIPVYTNGVFAFSPDTHRLLQVAANIYDASTNRTDRGGPEFPFLPSVFRPVFKIVGSNVFIGNWVEVTGGTAWTNTPRIITNPDVAVTVQPDDNLFDVPWIIGVKKGFPNFNEFSLRSVASITRRLLLEKSVPSPRPIRTNQMFLVGVSNLFAFEAWNSYPSNYSRDVEIIAINYITAELCFTNDATLDSRSGRLTTNYVLSIATNIPAGVWSGAGNVPDAPEPNSFVIPYRTNLTFLPDSIYRASSGLSPFFTTSTNIGTGLRAGYEVSGLFPIPEFHFSITNRIRFYMVDGATGRLVDYLCLGELGAQRNLSAELVEESDVSGSFGLWSTNRVGGTGLSIPPAGVMNQIQISLGNQDIGDWRNNGVNQPSGSARNLVIDSFRAFCGLAPIFHSGTINTNLLAVAPFTPTRRTSQILSWQANDPLVHSLAANLGRPALGSGLYLEMPFGPLGATDNVGMLNYRFEPWSEALGYPGTQLNPLLKDPIIRRPADWPDGNFGPLSLAWLGQVHRGTPWQSIYLKSGAVDPNLWTNWLGNWPYTAAFNSRPVADWEVVSEIARILNTNHPQFLLSANSPDTNQWSTILAGMSVLTNTASDASLNFGGVPPASQLVTDPDSPQSQAISAAIRQFQQVAGPLQSPGDLLSVAELSLTSPWLNRSSEIQLARGITDEAYEKIPSQLLSLLRYDLKLTSINATPLPGFRVIGYDGFPCVIEASPDLSHWIRLGTNQPTDGFFWFTDNFADGADARFYRAFVLP